MSIRIMASTAGHVEPAALEVGVVEDPGLEPDLAGRARPRTRPAPPAGAAAAPPGVALGGGGRIAEGDVRGGRRRCRRPSPERPAVRPPSHVGAEPAADDQRRSARRPCASQGSTAAARPRRPRARSRPSSTKRLDEVPGWSRCGPGRPATSGISVHVGVHREAEHGDLHHRRHEEDRDHPHVPRICRNSFTITRQSTPTLRPPAARAGARRARRRRSRRRPARPRRPSRWRARRP